jgi:hypothetical protein
MYLKIGFEDGTVPLPADLIITVEPVTAGLTARVNTNQFVLRNEDIAVRTVLNGTNAFGEWSIKIARNTIPPTLRKRDGNGQLLTENLAGAPHYYLAPERVKNMGLILVYEANIDWPGA